MYDGVAGYVAGAGGAGCVLDGFGAIFVAQDWISKEGIEVEDMPRFRFVTRQSLCF